MARVLIVEPYYGGSHKRFIDEIVARLFGGETQSGSAGPSEGSTEPTQGSESAAHTVSTLTPDQPAVWLATLGARKWKWRLTCSAGALAEKIPREVAFDVLLCSSMTNLTELLGLRADLHTVKKKLIYFHENQMVYPVRDEKERDLQLPWIQAMSALAADTALFNSSYNRDSFLENIGALLRKMPADQRPADLAERLQAKCCVLYFPVLSGPGLLEHGQSASPAGGAAAPLHVVWNHRWEHDKRPDIFFEALKALHAVGIPFALSVVGESFERCPEVFASAKLELADHIRTWGFMESRDQYLRVLKDADVVVSTTDHEFLGLSIIEATAQRCFPLCPRRLVFPEYLPEDCLWTTPAQLQKRLRYFCRYPNKLRSWDWASLVDLSKFSWETLEPEYRRWLLD